MKWVTTMSSCEDQGFPCQNLDYSAFDKIARAELSDPIDADELVNASKYCMRIPVDPNLTIGDLDHKLFLKVLRDKIGLYQLWVDYQTCDDHGSNTMLCVYVGKGPPEIRVSSHIGKKWASDVDLFATFTPMSNRLAKYYEQLFLDTYAFDLNSLENSGTEKLYAIWNEERYTLGTHLHEISNISKMQSPHDW